MDWQPIGFSLVLAPCISRRADGPPSSAARACLQRRWLRCARPISTASCRRGGTPPPGSSASALSWTLRTAPLWIWACRTLIGAIWCCWLVGRAPALAGCEPFELQGSNPPSSAHLPPDPYVSLQAAAAAGRPHGAAGPGAEPVCALVSARCRARSLLCRLLWMLREVKAKHGSPPWAR